MWSAARSPDVDDVADTAALDVAVQAQLTQEVKRADSLSAELGRQQDESSRGLKGTKSHRATGDILMGRTPTLGGAEPLIPASRPAGPASTAGSELELLRRKLKVGRSFAVAWLCTPLLIYAQSRKPRPLDVPSRQAQLPY